MCIGWGVIGCGRIATGRVIPEGIIGAENAELIGVADTDPAHAHATAHKFETKAFGSTGELLADSAIKAVYISAPPVAHKQLVIAAARAGKHVLCQKPIAMNFTEGDEMVRVCREQNVLLGIGLMMRYHGAHQKMMKMIKADVIGRPVAARVCYSVWAPPVPSDAEFGAWIHDPKVAGGGPMMDMGTHAIDLLSMMLGRIIAVSSFCDTLVHSYEVEDTCSVILKFENGAQAVMECYMSIPNFEGRRMVEIYGSEGMLVAENTIFQLPTGNLWYSKKTDGGESDRLLSYTSPRSGGCRVSAKESVPVRDTAFFGGCRTSWLLPHSGRGRLRSTTGRRCRLQIISRATSYCA